MNVVSVVHAIRQLLHLYSVHEQPNVTTDAILLVDHAKAYTWKAALKIREHIANRVSICTYTCCSLRIGAKWTRDLYCAGHWKRTVSKTLEIVRPLLLTANR
jgi:hypothetical protein